MIRGGRLLNFKLSIRGSRVESLSLGTPLNSIELNDHNPLPTILQGLPAAIFTVLLTGTDFVRTLQL